jgi:hypothetical protein
MIFHKGDVVYQRWLGPFEGMRGKAFRITKVTVLGGVEYTAHRGKESYAFRSNEVTVPGGAAVARQMSKIYEAKHWLSCAEKNMRRVERELKKASDNEAKRMEDLRLLEKELENMTGNDHLSKICRSVDKAYWQMP